MSVTEVLDYQSIFDRQEIDTRFRNPQDYFFEQVPDTSKDHAGDFYAIPRTISVRPYVGLTGEPITGNFNIRDNGALVRPDANLDPSVDIGLRCVLYGGGLTVKEGVVIDDGSEIGAHFINSRTEIGMKVFTAPRVVLGEDVVLEDAVVLGQYTEIGHGTLVGPGTRTDKFVKIYDRARIGAANDIREGATIYSNVVTESEVRIDERVTIGEEARLDKGVRVMPGLRVRMGRHIRKNRIVVPEQFTGGAVMADSFTSTIAK